MPRTTSAWIVFAALAAGAVGRQVVSNEQGGVKSNKKAHHDKRVRAGAPDRPPHSARTLAHRAARSPPLISPPPTPLQARAEGPLDRCSEHWFEQRLDHFRWWPADSGSGGSAAARGARSHAAAARDLAAPAPPLTWRQRYFVCDEHYGGPGSPIWFYAGAAAA